MIKDGWNIPNRIPFASEVKVADGDPVTQEIVASAHGVLKYYILKGDYLERIREIKRRYSNRKGLFVVVADEEDRRQCVIISHAIV